MNSLELNTVSRAFVVAKKILDEVKPAIDSLNVIYDSQGGVKSSVTQEELDAIASFSGITKAQLDDGLYALTAGIKGVVDGAFSQLSQLAARA
jgi:hypothetical protein